MTPSLRPPLSVPVAYPSSGTDVEPAPRRRPARRRGAPFRAIIASLFAVAFLAGCAGPPVVHYPATTAAQNFVAPEAPATLDPALLRLSAEPFTLGPGDRLDIEFVGDPASRASAEVGPDGRIYFYLLPGLDVWGLTLPETRELIAEKSTRFLRARPVVSLTLRAVGSKRIWMLGRLNNPGIFAMPGPMTLLEAISEAGGPTPALAAGPGGVRLETSDLRRGFVLRRGELLPVDFRKLLLEGDLSQNIYLQADDFVYLPSATTGTVHILGAVAFPRAVVSGGALTLIQTIANAGGPVKDAYLSHVAIVRGSLSSPTISIVDYRAVIKGAAPDVLLEPHDIVYVPHTPYRTLTRYTDLILNTFVRTVGVNEGARAISGDAGPVGVTVQVSP